MELDTQREIIAFELRNQNFCLDVASVLEIRGWAPATPIPKAAFFVLGVVNLRGTMLPIIDLAARLGFGKTVPSDRHAIVVVQVARQLVGLLVDGVSEIMSVETGSIQPSPTLGNRVISEFVRGMLNIEGRMISMLHLDDLFASSEAEAA